MVISALVSAGILILMYYKLDTEDKKIGGLKFIAIVTVILHYSSLWVDYLEDGEATIGSEMLFAVHPCHVLMWMLFVSSFLQKKSGNISGKIVQLMNEFLFFGGIVCGSIGIIINENFGNNPTLTDYHVLKGLLSHSTMIIGCIYVLVGGFIKIRVKNLFGIIAGLSLFIVDGVIVNSIFAIAGLDTPNSMYLMEPPFANMPWLNTAVIGVAALLVGFTATAIYEAIALPKEERWYTLLSAKIKARKEAR